ncbi:MAG TPA: chemotaxis protein CheA, partial [Polyangiaceae bacterium]|nr:chemotaxis protein CheA [Polyangiaceae bacterium]
LLDNLRLGRADLSPPVIVLLFRSVELYGRILQSETEGRDLPMPEFDELVRQLSANTRGGQSPSSPGQYELDPSLLAVLTEYEEHRLRTNIAQGMTLYRLRVQFQLATIDNALDELKVTAKPYGEIITYLPTGAGADAESIELDILMASRSTIDELRAALGASGVEVEEVPRRPAGPDVGPRVSTPPPAPSTANAHTHHGGAPQTPPPSLATPSQATASELPRVEPPKAEIGTIKAVAQTVRVDIHKLDRLMNIVGELAIVCTSLGRMVEELRATRADRELASNLHRLQRAFDRYLDSMQQGILEVRMVPLGQVFDRLARVVRQISREAEKNVNLVITGAETEVDKLIVEELSDPLMHMMRNAIDHGIERREERMAVGKAETGTIALTAFQKGNHVVIEIEDDGRGIPTDKLLEAAIRRGILSPYDARVISKREILNLVFLPGITTKAEVSTLSGRGVGMDVVKTNISKLGGVIDLQSENGIGTKVTITLPITLAIISALIVRIADRLFAIPLANVQEAIVLDETTVRIIDGREVVTLRGNTLQLCYLARLFGLNPSIRMPNVSPAGGVARSLEAPANQRSFGGMSGSTGGSGGGGGMPSMSTSVGHRKDARTVFDSRRSPNPSMRISMTRQYIVVTAVGSRRLGLVVDTLIGEQDVVIKALGASLKDVRGFAGATELGDQRLALVLDTPALIEEMHAGADRTRTADPRGAHG